MTASSMTCARPAAGRVAKPEGKRATLVTPRAAPLVTKPVTQQRSAVVRASSVDQDKAMREAEARWQDNLRQGKVRNVTGNDLKSMIEGGWTVLDVRPAEEQEVVSVKGAVEVPLFEVDDSMDIGSLLKQMSAFGMGGWWEGTAHMKANTQFMAQVQSKIPKDAKIIVTCQKGLRSLAACEQLSRAGYTELAWVSGGLDTVRPGQVDTIPENKDLRYSAIGGLSEVIGWTEVQQDESKNEDGSFGVVLKVAGVLLALDALVFAYEELQFLSGQ